MNISYYETRKVKRIIFDWQSGSDGICSGTTKDVSGIVARITFSPDSAGTQPTLNYTATINDSDGIDVAVGFGSAGLSNTTSESIIPLLSPISAGDARIVIDGKLTLNIAGAGDTKGGIITIYLQE